MTRYLKGFLLIATGLASLCIIWAALPLLVLLNESKPNDILDYGEDDPGVDID